MPIYPDGPYNKRDRYERARDRLISGDWMIDPKAFRQQELREPSRPQIRGCGDPDCSYCNPELAEQRARTGLTGTPIPGGGRPTPEPLNAPDTVKKYLTVAPEQAFTDIIGNEEALALLRDAIEAPVKYADLYAAYNMKMPKGALLSGPPGCGKTMFARAAASTMRELYGMKEFICLNGADLQSMFVGATEAMITEIFSYAREYAHRNGHPLLIFMDEAEVMLPDRTGRTRRVAPWEESQVATFLAQMDGIVESGAFVLLATNRPDAIDQAVLRDGRCDFKITVKRPTQKAIEHIIRNSFTNSFLAEPVEALVFAAVETFYHPDKVIVDLHSMSEDMKHWLESKGANLEKVHEHFKVFGGRNFSFEHIVSGAMAASVASRATRRAFSRDKLIGKASGVTTTDVIEAVNGIFEENKTLEHQFAWEEFAEQLIEELRAIK